MPEQSVDTLDYLTDEQIVQQILDCSERSSELKLAATRNDARMCRLTLAHSEREIRKLGGPS